jgi:hypothetical protein
MAMPGVAGAAGGSGLFENYEQDYSNISTSISRKINTQIPSQAGGKALCKRVRSWVGLIRPTEAKKVTIRAVEREFEEAEEIVSGSGFSGPLGVFCLPFAAVEHGDGTQQSSSNNPNKAAASVSKLQK